MMVEYRISQGNIINQNYLIKIFDLQKLLIISKSFQIDLQIQFLIPHVDLFFINRNQHSPYLFGIIPLMNANYQTAIDIKSRINQQNPFILKLPVNSTSQQHVNLLFSAHLLKKLSLVDISQSKQLTDLYKQSLLDVIQNPLLDIKSQSVIEQLLYFLEFWHSNLGQAASWPHTRTCFYYLEDRMKKNKLHNNLDLIRLKRAQLQINKKEFLSQIMAEDVKNQQLRSYISELKEQSQIRSEHDNFKHKSINEQKQINQQKQQEISVSSNILYRDTKQDWKQLSQIIKAINTKEKQFGKQLQTDVLKVQIHDLLQTYIVERLSVQINCMKSIKLSKQKILEQLNLRKQVLENFGVKQFIQPLTLIVSKLLYHNNF